MGPAAGINQATERSRGVCGGTRLHDGRYTLRSLLGWSHLASVWSAQDNQGPQRDVAIKVAMLGSHDAQLCVAREALALSDLQARPATPSKHTHKLRTGPPTTTSPATQHPLMAAASHTVNQASILDNPPLPRDDGGLQGAQQHVVRLLDSFVHVTAGGQQAVRCVVLERLGDTSHQVLRRAPQPGHNSNATTTIAPPGTVSRAGVQGPVTGVQGLAAGVPTSRASGQQQQQRVMVAGQCQQGEELTPLPVEAVKKLTCDMLLGLKHLHSRGWVHRDLKPANIVTRARVLPRRPAKQRAHPPHAQDPHTRTQPHASDTTHPLDQQPHPPSIGADCLKQAEWKLIDFGNAAYVGLPVDPQASAAGAAAAAAGPAAVQRLLRTSAYAPPEDLLGVMPRTRGGSSIAGQHVNVPAIARGPPWSHPANDMWSLGCLVYECSTGRKLFDATRCRHLLSGASATSGSRQGLGAAGVQQTAGLGSRGGSDAPRGSIWPTWPWARAEDVRRNVESEGFLPLGAIKDEELQLWHMVHVLGPLDVQVLSRATSAFAVTLLDPEGGSRLDHHPLAVAALHRAAQRHAGGVGDEAALLLPLGERLAVEGHHMSQDEVQGLGSFLSQLLVYEPTDRLSADCALQHPWLQPTHLQ